MKTKLLNSNGGYEMAWNIIFKNVISKIVDYIIENSVLNS
jgi:hypothetical protein